MYLVADEYLVHEAPSRQLLRLRKDELVDLYTAATLAGDADVLTKQEIVDAIISSRDGVAELPPSSRSGFGDGPSSGYSSDEGNAEGDEETDRAAAKSSPNLPTLRRRATVNDSPRTITRLAPNRSVSLGSVLPHPRSAESRRATRTSHDVNGEYSSHNVAKLVSFLCVLLIHF
jgi:mitogen-activated protein kinase kinase kinase 13